MSVYLPDDNGSGDGLQIIVAGRFQCDSGVIVVCDPCYRTDENLISRFDNAKAGPWQASIRVGDFGPGLGKRVESLTVMHVAYLATDGHWLDSARAVAVDTGRMAVADGQCSLDDDLIPAMAAIGARCVTVSSGFGDGIYPCRFREVAGEVVAIEVRFIGDDLAIDDGGGRDLLGSLMRIWRSLGEDDRCELLDHARWLAGDSRLVGGPLDGLRLPERYKDAASVSFEIDGKAAVYDRGGDTMLRFDGFRRIGGEGGTWPDVRADELQALKGGEQ